MYNSGIYPKLRQNMQKKIHQCELLKSKQKNSGSLCDDKQDSYESSVNTEKYTWEAWERQTCLVKILPLINQSAWIFGAKKWYH